MVYFALHLTTDRGRALVVGQGIGLRATAACVIALCMLACVETSAAQDTYPRKPIRMIVGFPPGGQSDTVARLLGAKLSADWGKAIVIENVTGAAGSLSAERVAKATPDGYTLGLLASPQLSINPSLYKLAYDPVRDFAPVSLVALSPTVLVVHTGVPVRTVRELIQLAKARPGELTFASSGIGTEGHLTGELLKSVAGLDIRHIPYKGVVAAVPDLLSERVTMMFSPTVVVLPLVRESKLRALAITSLKRSAAAPELPTVAESGYPGFEVTGWQGLVAPAATPAAIVGKLQVEITNVLALPDLRAKLADLGMDPIGNSPAEFAGVIKTGIARWAKVIREADIRPD